MFRSNTKTNSKPHGKAKTTNSRKSTKGTNTTGGKKTISSWQAFTLKDAYQPRKPIMYAVVDLIETPSLNILYGPPGCLKSFLLADMAVCVAGDIPWLSPLPGVSRAPFQVTQCPVVWVDFDNGKRRTHERFAALGRTYGVPESIPLSYYSMPNPWLDTRDEQQVEELAGLIKQKAAKLVIIDNLGYISGGADENSVEMVEVMAHLRWLAEETGAAIVVIHHSRKSRSDNSRKGDSLRGHSSIEGSLDLALMVQRDGNASAISVIPTKIRGVEVKKFTCAFTYQHDPRGELSEARFFAGDGLIAIKAIMDAVLDCLGSATMNKTELAKDAHAALNGTVGLNRIRSTIDEMCSQGYLVSTKGKNNANEIKRNPNKQI